MVEFIITTKDGTEHRYRGTREQYERHVKAGAKVRLVETPKTPEASHAVRR